MCENRIEILPVMSSSDGRESEVENSDCSSSFSGSTIKTRESTL